mmetsp:Transcript_25508/g.37424  ORF Transcript_25508/g.37424 Transcript_25508/m.37424 type:complete len:110 (+) Transcript_25508:178-507(+)
MPKADDNSAKPNPAIPSPKTNTRNQKKTIKPERMVPSTENIARDIRAHVRPLYMDTGKEIYIMYHRRVKQNMDRKKEGKKSYEEKTREHQRERNMIVMISRTYQLILKS